MRGVIFTYQIGELLQKKKILRKIKKWNENIHCQIDRKTGEIGVYSIDASPDGKQALLDGEFTAVACQVPLQIAEYAFDAAEKYVGGDTELGEKKVYLDSHLVEKEEAEKTLSDWQ